MLAARDLAFGFASRRVGSGVSLELARGETLAVLGGNGAGKTTLLRTLLGLLPPLGGHVELDGHDVRLLDAQARARTLAYVPQQQASGFAFTVIDMVLMSRAAHLPLLARPAAQDRAIALDALDRLGVAHLAARVFAELSGGERQLVLVARALAQQSPVLVLDVPTASLDFGFRARVLAELDRLRGGGLAIVFSTHEPEHALAHADVALLLDGGRPLAFDAVARALTAVNVERLYGVGVELIDVGTRKVFVPSERRAGADGR
jgi:iron complex transport system ATP-binding protein